MSMDKIDCFIQRKTGIELLILFFAGIYLVLNFGNQSSTKIFPHVKSLAWKQNKLLYSQLDLPNKTVRNAARNKPGLLETKTSTLHEYLICTEGETTS